MRHEDVLTPELSLAWLSDLVRRRELRPEPPTFRQERGMNPGAAAQRASAGAAAAAVVLPGFQPLVTYKGAGEAFDVVASMKRSVWFNEELYRKDATVSRVAGRQGTSGGRALPFPLTSTRCIRSAHTDPVACGFGHGNDGRRD